MTSERTERVCDKAELVPLLAMGSLPPEERAAAQAHVDSCSSCRQELKALEEVTETFASWPTNVVRPSHSLWGQVANRIGTGAAPDAPLADDWQEPEWTRVAPGISCKLLAIDGARSRVSMLVQLDPGAAYPPHTHEGVEELHLLDGELWIEDRKLYPGDFNRGEPGASDHRVWSETGCTCVLITSLRDVIS